MSGSDHESETPQPAGQYDLRSAQAILDACSDDLDREEQRMTAIDGKLTQLSAFSGVSISISAGVGGSVLAAGRLPEGFAIALGACLGLAAIMLLTAVIRSFGALSPKLYHGIDEAAVAARTTPAALRTSPDVMVATIAAGRRDMLIAARAVNDRKARATTVTFVLVGIGFLLLVASLLVTAVGAVL